jgi:N-acetylmuramic acid 6-phosphate etherase
MSVQFIIGIDGGGTKTHGRIKEVNTGTFFELNGGPSSLSNDFALASKTISNLLLQLMDKFDSHAQCKPENISVVIGVAGGGVASQATKLASELPFSFANLEVCNDAKTSLFGANNGEPVTVVALGTGSVGARLDAESREHYYGGWGFPVGDDGGGAKLGLSAVQSLLHELDSHDAKKDLNTTTLPESSSALLVQLLEMIGPKPSDLPEWLANVTPAKYAAICPLIFALESKCKLAKKLIKQHVHHCEQLILTSRKNSKTPVVLLGGLSGVTFPFLTEAVTEYCQLALGTSLDGACLLAEKNSQNLSGSTPKPVTKKDQLVSDPVLLQQLNNMVSEERNPNSKQIDLMDSQGILRLINNEDKNVPLAVELCIEPMSQAVDQIVNAFNQGGRLIYMGAGTSGRLGVLDAVECPPTFSVSPDQVIGIIAGGDKAIYKAVEGAEDNAELGKQDLENINFNAKDVLVGIAASGRTPYVIGALDHANKIGAKTVCVTCNPNSEMTKHANIVICPVVGPEVLTGSTRLKSGTAQKLVLNMLSTASMIRTGKSYENLMVDVNASNKKLYMRAIRIVMQATQCSADIAEQALNKTDFKVKLAILHILTGVEPKQGELTLLQNKGFLRSSVEALNS